MVQQVRVGLIGLSSSATGFGWAAAAHLPYLLNSPYFRITALLNSSIENSRKAIDAYHLPADTKAYENPDDLANDPDVDLVVASVRVDRHAQVLLPSILAGKDVFCEWPLDKNAEIAKTMTEAAKKGGGRTIVGLQARLSPVIQTVKKLVESGRIGRPLSSTIIGAAEHGGAEEPAHGEYLTDRQIGGNMLTIHFGHAIDYVFYTLGEPKWVNTILANQRPHVNIVDNSTTPPTVLRTVAKDTPDQIVLQALLESDTILSLHLRGGPPMPSSASASSSSQPVSNNSATMVKADDVLTQTPQFVWRIYGEVGEVEVTASGVLLSTSYGYLPDLKILLHDHKSGKTEKINLEPDEFFDTLPAAARNIGRVYEKYAEVTGVKSVDHPTEDGLVSFGEAMKRHDLIDTMLKRWDDKQQGWTMQ